MAQHSDVEVHGRKRPADGEPDDQPLARKFGRLHIGPLTAHRFPDKQEKPARLPPAPRQGSGDAMMLDDTRDTVYIHDLEHELAECESLDGPVTILPGLENKLSMSKILIPTTTRPQCNELVLYREPESLSIPKSRDNVRKALIETRERARMSQSRYQSAPQDRTACPHTDGSSDSSDHDGGPCGIGVDRMDLDVDVWG